MIDDDRIHQPRKCQSTSHIDACRSHYITANFSMYLLSIQNHCRRKKEALWQLCFSTLHKHLNVLILLYYECVNCTNAECSSFFFCGLKCGTFSHFTLWHVAARTNRLLGRQRMCNHISSTIICFMNVSLISFWRVIWCVCVCHFINDYRLAAKATM